MLCSSNFNRIYNICSNNAGDFWVIYVRRNRSRICRDDGGSSCNIGIYVVKWEIIKWIF